MLESLKKFQKNARLYVFAFDQNCFEILKKINDPNIIPISLNEFEDSELLKVKSTRSRAEYCWTSTPSTIKYVFDNFKEAECTYLDADLLFLNSPEIILKELKENQSVLITPHFYTKEYDQSTERGIYCVQFMHFKNQADSYKVLSDWRKDCLAWCYARVEEGKFGDQKYLDYWEKKYNCIHSLSIKQLCLAPWNIQQFKLEKNKEDFWVLDKQTGSKTKPVFFHFHGVKLYEKNNWIPAPKSYRIGSDFLSWFYKPYAEQLLKIDESLKGLINPKYGSLNQYYFDKIMVGNIAWFKKNILNRFFNTKFQ